MRCTAIAAIDRFSTLQRVEIAEILARKRVAAGFWRFSTLQRVEIAEMRQSR